MPVLHKYAPSSRKDGYYMRDSYDGQVVTYQLTNPATNILLALNYDDEDQVPNEILLLMYNFRLIYTHRSSVEPAKSVDNLPDLGSDDAGAISEQTREKFYSLLHDHENLSSDQLFELEHYAKSYQIQLNTSTSTGDSDSDPEPDQVRGSRLKRNGSSRLLQRYRWVWIHRNGGFRRGYFTTWRMYLDQISTRTRS